MAMALEMADEHTIVILSLTDRPKGEAALRWEFTCDHCGKFCLPEREKFITGDITTQLPGIGQINITVGLCAECAAIEQVPQPEGHQP